MNYYEKVHGHPRHQGKEGRAEAFPVSRKIELGGKNCWWWCIIQDMTRMKMVRCDTWRCNMCEAQPRYFSSCAHDRMVNFSDMLSPQVPDRGRCKGELCSHFCKRRPRRHWGRPRQIWPLPPVDTIFLAIKELELCRYGLPPTLEQHDYRRWLQFHLLHHRQTHLW